MGENKIESRVSELEIQLSFQEDHIEKLNDVLVDQQSRIEKLEVVIRHYEKRLQEIQNGVSGDDSNEIEIPPHY